MTVIGYIRTCRRCLATMVLTTDGRDQTLCPRCLDDSIAQAIEDAINEEVEGEL